MQFDDEIYTYSLLNVPIMFMKSTMEEIEEFNSGITKTNINVPSRYPIGKNSM